MATASTIDYKSDIERAQMVRLWDILFIAPILIIVGLLPSTPLWAKFLLIAIGIGTFLYNGNFYLKYKNK